MQDYEKNGEKGMRRSLVRKGSRVDRLLEGQLGSPMFSWRQILTMLSPLIMDSFFYLRDQYADYGHDQFFQPGIGVGGEPGQSPLHDDLRGL